MMFQKKEESYEWTVSDPKRQFLGDSYILFTSEMIEFYGLQWMLEVDVGGRATLNLVSKEHGYSTICVRFIIAMPELGTHFVTTGIFGGKKQSKEWGTKRINLLKVVDLEQLTIQLHLELIDIV